MNSQKKFNAAPKFLWPQLRSSDASLEIGNIGGCSYIGSTPQSINWNYMNEAQTCKNNLEILNNLSINIKLSFLHCCFRPRGF
jgi:hypothetical protein